MTSVRVSLDATAIPEQPGGAGRYVVELAAALPRLGTVDLTVVCRRGDADRWRGGPGPAPVAVVEAGPSMRPVRLAWEQAALPRLLAGLAVDVHHAPHYTMPHVSRLPTVVTVHDLSFFSHPEWHERTKPPFFRAAIRAAAARADAIVAVSAATASGLEARVNVRAPVHVIPHGVDHARFHPGDGGAADHAARARIGARQPYVAFLGTLEPRKDVPTLVRAFDRVAARHPDLTLVLAGARGWGAVAVESAVRAITHRDRVRLAGYVDEPDAPALLRGAAAVAYPSLEEGFGLPALEALACGAPLVTTTGSAMEEVATGAALLVDPGDVDGLAHALDALVVGGAAVDERRRLGLETAARYSWAASAAAHVEVYRSVS